MTGSTRAHPQHNTASPRLSLSKCLPNLSGGSIWGKPLPDLASITVETALRLSAAAALAYPDGSMTASGLRRERDAERLETWFTAGKEYTSLAAIEEMVKKCRAMRKARASGSSPSELTNDAACETRPSGSSETEAESLALAAALMRCQPPRTPSADI